jgi:hypothetical protein
MKAYIHQIQFTIQGARRYILPVTMVVFLLISFRPGVQAGLPDGVRNDTIVSDKIELEGGITFFRDNLLYASNTKYATKLPPEFVSFGRRNLYISDPQSILEFPHSVFTDGNSFHALPADMVFSAADDRVYFGCTARKEKGNQLLYEADLITGGSSSELEFIESSVDVLPFCQESVTYMHPAISADDDFMVFSADGPGSQGGFDLYCVVRKGDAWGVPVNLGSTVNTKGDEMYPYIDAKNTLYFSSDGRSGYGGFDIYVCKSAENGWEAPMNLMDPINSDENEIAFTTGASGSSAFYISESASMNEPPRLIRLVPPETKTISDFLIEQAIARYNELLGTGYSFDPEDRILFAAVFKEESVADNEIPVAPRSRQQETSSLQPESPLPTTGNLSPSGETHMKKTIPEEPAEPTGQVDPEELSGQEVSEPNPREEEMTGRENASTPIEEPEEEVADVVYFRVQIVSSAKPNDNYRVTIDGKGYPTFQYYYKGAYRFTVGNFTDLDEAKAFQTRCRASGFNQAFVAAFIHDERVTDPSVFRR